MACPLIRTVVPEALNIGDEDEDLGEEEEDGKLSIRICHISFLSGGNFLGAVGLEQDEETQPEPLSQKVSSAESRAHVTSSC